MTPARPLIVAIDGPAGVGKTTVARRLAARLGVPYLETGAMYRALGWKVLAEGIDPDDRAQVEALAERLDLGLAARPGGRIEVLLDGDPVGERIRSPEVAAVTSRVSLYPRVRRRMVELQRSGAVASGAVLEGRDIGTKVFPDAPFKFYLDADTAVRARRRFEELNAEGDGELSFAEVLRQVAERDERDRARPDSPLARDESYEIIDTGRVSADEVVERIAAAIEGRIGRDRSG